MIKVVVIGATGYAAEELLKILVGHPQVQITNLIGRREKPEFQTFQLRVVITVESVGIGFFDFVHQLYDCDGFVGQV